MTTEPGTSDGGEGAGFTTAVTEAVVDSMSGTADPPVASRLVPLTRAQVFGRFTSPLA